LKLEHYAPQWNHPAQECSQLLASTAQIELMWAN